VQPFFRPSAGISRGERAGKGHPPTVQPPWGSTANALSVKYELRPDGTATAPADYGRSAHGILETWAGPGDGGETKTITITIVKDAMKGAGQDVSR